MIYRGFFRLWLAFAVAWLIIIGVIPFVAIVIIEGPAVIGNAEVADAQAIWLAAAILPPLFGFIILRVGRWIVAGFRSNPALKR